MHNRRLVRFGLSALLLGSASFGQWLLAASDVRLIDAIKSQDQKSFEALIGQHTDVNVAQPDGATPLSWAVYLNQDENVDRLLKAGAKVNTADEYGEGPLTLACGIGNASLIGKLLAAGADVNSARWNGETALMIAARSGSLDSVKLLLEHGAKLEAVDSRKGQNALMWAAAEGHATIVDFLIKSGANVKTESEAGFTPLVFATQKGSGKIVESLIAAGADPNYKLPAGYSVLQVGVLAGKTQAALVLLDHDADVNVADKTGTTPLHTAAQAGNVEIVTRLLEKHADPNARTAKITATAGAGGGGGAQFRSGGEQTPLLLAARANKEKVMRALIAGGADPKLKTQDGSTLLMAAANSGHVEVVKYAYELSPDITALTSQKSTVMHQAVTGSLQNSTQTKVCEVIQFLADKGAAVDELDSRGRTPISIANILPIDNAVDLLTKLIEESGKTPKISPKR